MLELGYNCHGQPYHTSDLFTASISNKDNLYKLKSENLGIYTPAQKGKPHIIL